MEVVAYSNFRQNLRSVMRKVNDDADRLTVTTNDNTDIVVMSKTDYDSWMETFYLMSSSKNHTRLSQAISDIEKGKFTTRQLLELKE